MDEKISTYNENLEFFKKYYEKFSLEIKKRLVFPFDIRYIKLLNDNISLEELSNIFLTYSDEELDFFIYKLEEYIYKTSFEAYQREENVIFNKENDKVVLKKCLVEYNKRF